ncbi:MAG TPA: DoxX family protein [Flavitalea sp.]|nr:DoxX family protein [Flavitalea sp.]
MKKRNPPAGRASKIIYWVVTIFLSLGMTAGGVQQMLQIGGYNEIVSSLGYPLYLLSILGVWKLLGVVAILIPKFPLLKEWAYAGFFFAMSGAFISHVVVGQSFTEAVPSLILLSATVVSWYFRPNDRRLLINQNHLRTSVSSKEHY